MSLEGMSKQKVVPVEPVLITVCHSFLTPDLAKRPAKQRSCLAAEVSLMDAGGGFCTALATAFHKGLSSLLVLPPPCCPCCVLIKLFVHPCRAAQSPPPPGQGTNFGFIFNLGVAFAAFCPLPPQTVVLSQ